MQITKENIGDTLCLYASAKCIRILDVSPKYVHYATEKGYHYATYEHSADAIPVTDSERLAVFDENYKLGRTLNAAEYKAFVGLLNNSPNSPDTDKLLSTIREQQNHFSSRLKSDRGKMVPGEALATRFLSQLSERSSGSHDTFWGHRVQLISNWSYEFKIDGKTMDYSSAVTYLSKARFAEERKPSLNETIKSGNIRRELNSSSGIKNSLSVPER